VPLLPPLPKPPAGLFPRAAERARISDYLSRALEAALERVASGSTVPDIDRERFRAELVRFDFATPRPLEAVLEWTLAQLEHGITHMTHPCHFGLFNPNPTLPAQCADRIAGAFNPQLASSASSPVPVELEAHVIRAVGARAGLAAPAGHFATGGAEANYTALVLALTRADPGFAAHGTRAFAGPTVLYASRESHGAWHKIAHQAGIGRAALNLVASDGAGRMDPRALAAAIALDRTQGRVPVMVAATAGTTAAGMIDPLAAIGTLAAREGLWFHVDAAWGGAALASERLRPQLAGIAAADSITIDAHKWFATTMGCAMFITPHAALLSQAFHSSTSYMPSSDAALDPYLTTVQWSRRFLGLRLFLSLATVGWAGYAQHVERAVAVIERVRTGLEQRGWTTVNDSPLALLAVLPPPALGEVRALVQRVVRAGRAWVAAASFEGRDVVRICATNGETRERDVDTLIEALNAPSG
jgi:glutamate/tyrosine decarboxylase-like PLP-dependent enzyme